MPSYRIPQPRIVYEVLNNEVIAIDFNTGHYYALAHVAKQVWQLIEQQIPPHQIALLLANHYRREIDLVAGDVEQFFKQLLKEGLIEETDSAPKDLAKGIEESNWDYEPPKLQEYTDVQDLLLLDPIHEVTEMGWPDRLK